MCEKERGVRQPNKGRQTEEGKGKNLNRWLRVQMIPVLAEATTHQILWADSNRIPLTPGRSWVVRTKRDSNHKDRNSKPPPTSFVWGRAPPGYSQEPFAASPNPLPMGERREPKPKQLMRCRICGEIVRGKSCVAESAIKFPDRKKYQWRT